MVENKATKQRILTGRVVSNKMNKSVVISIERHERHPLYKKIMTISSKLHAHDEGNVCKEGDLVRVGEVKPISKTKTWTVLEVLEKAQ